MEPGTTAHPAQRPEHVDVVVIGAGLSGIGAACQLREQHPGRSVAVLESRERLGGTWDLFRYPGIRSDSDMFTFGYRWRPWRGETALASGPMILDYLRTVARERGVEELVRYSRRVVAADWDSGAARWRLTVERTGDREPGQPQVETISCALLWSCTGYYDYEAGHTPELPGLAEFEGTLVHPQAWPEDLDHTGKRVVVVGSGATAITLVPAMAERAAHVTMLQRSPGYVLSLPGKDPLARRLARLPERISYPVLRWKNVMAFWASYQLARRRPALVRRLIRRQTLREVPHLEVDVHFKPRYDPWDQRMCFVPDGDLFEALRGGRASVVTGAIETVTAGGVRLATGEHIDADVLVTATGLRLLAFGGLALSVDGEPVDLPRTMAYKAMMLSGVPNFVYTVGYTSASWTLKADLVGEFVCRLLARLDERGARSAVAHRDPTVGERPFIDLSSGYVQRSLDDLPRQGDRVPWRLEGYLSDVRHIRRAPIEDGVLTLR